MHGRPITRIGFVLVLASLLVSSCSWRKTLWEVGLGSFATDLSVARVVQRHTYLEATLVGHGLALTVYVPASEECAFVLKHEEPVDYVERGIGGRYEREGVSCDAVGIGDPLIRRARQPRSSSQRSSLLPRSQATFSKLYEDDGVIMLRGRFPEATRIGWALAEDCVAVVENTPVCRKAAEGGVASMEYRPSGRNTLALVSSQGLCRLIGLVIPPT